MLSRYLSLCVLLSVPYMNGMEQGPKKPSNSYYETVSFLPKWKKEAGASKEELRKVYIENEKNFHDDYLKTKQDFEKYGSTYKGRHTGKEAEKDLKMTRKLAEAATYVKEEWINKNPIDKPNYFKQIPNIFLLAKKNEIKQKESIADKISLFAVETPKVRSNKVFSKLMQLFPEDYIGSYTRQKSAASLSDESLEEWLDIPHDIQDYRTQRKNILDEYVSVRKKAMLEQNNNTVHLNQHIDAIDDMYARKIVKLNGFSTTDIIGKEVTKTEPDDIFFNVISQEEEQDILGRVDRQRKYLIEHYDNVMLPDSTIYPASGYKSPAEEVQNIPWNESNYYEQQAEENKLIYYIF